MLDVDCWLVAQICKSCWSDIWCQSRFPLLGRQHLSLSSYSSQEGAVVNSYSPVWRLIWISNGILRQWWWKDADLAELTTSSELFLVRFFELKSYTGSNLNAKAPTSAHLASHPLTSNPWQMCRQGLFAATKVPWNQACNRGNILLLRDLNQPTCNFQTAVTICLREKEGFDNIPLKLLGIVAHVACTSVQHNIHSCYIWYMFAVKCWVYVMYFMFSTCTGVLYDWECKEAYL